MDRRVLIRCALLGALAWLLFSPPAEAQCGAEKLGAASPAGSDAFGTSVALAGATALVGAPFDDGAAADAGAVQVLRLVSGAWLHDGELSAHDAAAGRLFGAAVALDGTRGVVGAPAWAAADKPPGSAYLVEDGPAGWAEVATLAPADAQPLQQFGRAVAVSGDAVLVGAPGDGQLGQSAGAAYVFELGPMGWTQTAKLTAAGGDSAHAFGRAVAIDGDTALVGSLGGSPKEFAGAVHVFERTLHGWARATVFFLADGFPGHDFGLALDLEGSRALVGSPGYDHHYYESGAAFVFEREGSTWTQVAKLVPGSLSGPWEYDHLGAAVALEGDRALVGGPDCDGGEGAAFSFHDAGAYWLLDAKWKAYDAPGGGRYGSAVAFAGERALVGAPGDDGAAPDAGAVYSLDYPLAGCPPLYAVPDAVPLATGGTQYLTLYPGIGQEHPQTWLLLGSASGTSPGIAGPGGIVLPLNADEYLRHTLLYPNSPPLPKSLAAFGYLDHASATFELPAGLPPSLAGTVLHHAYLIFDSWSPELLFASNAVPVLLY